MFQSLPIDTTQIIDDTDPSAEYSIDTTDILDDEDPNAEYLFNLINSISRLEHTEGFLSRTRVDGGLVSDDVESDSLGERTALPNSYNITILDWESRRAMNSNVLVSLLKTTVLDDVVKVVSANNNGALHLGRHHQSLQNTSSDGNVSSERALLVNEISLNGSCWRTNSETNILDPTHGLWGGTNGASAGNKHGILRLVGLLVLIALDVFLGNTGDSRHDYLIASEQTWNSNMCMVSVRERQQHVRRLREEQVDRLKTTLKNNDGSCTRQTL